MKPAPPPPYDRLYNSYTEYAPAAAVPAPTVVMAAPPAPTVLSITNMGTETSQPVGPKPVILTCPQCRCRGKTKIKRRSTLKTHLACLLLSWTVFCCFLPYCIDTCRNLDHFCPTCEAFVGSYSS